jgi:hypothetical protein
MQLCRTRQQPTSSRAPPRHISRVRPHIGVGNFDFAALRRCEGYPLRMRKKMCGRLVTYRHSAALRFEKHQAADGKVKEM